MRYSVFLFAVLLVAGVSFSVDVASCQLISSPGTYVLTSDLTGAPIPAFSSGSASACLKVMTSDVVIDCNGHSIDYNAAPPSFPAKYGILINNVSNVAFTNVSVRNCDNITRYTNHIEAFNLSNSDFSNITIYNLYPNLGLTLRSGSKNNIISDITGLNGYSTLSLLSSSDDNVVDNVQSFNNTFGLSIDSDGNNVTNSLADGLNGTSVLWGFDIGGSNNRISGSEARSNDLGFIIFGDNNVLTGNSAHDNPGDGFNINGADNNLLTLNTADNNAGSGFNVIGTGNNLTDNNATGNSEDGFAVGGTGNSVNCLANGNAGSGVHITGDSNTVTDCESFGNGEDGYLIQGASDNLIQDSVAYLNGQSGVEITNNWIPPSEGPAISLPALYNVMEGVHSYNNSEYGFHVFPSFDFVPLVGNNFIDVNGSENTLDGIYLESTSGSTVDPSYFCDNGGRGLSIFNSTGMNVFDSVMCDNGEEGMLVLSSFAVQAESDEAYGNGQSGFSLSESLDNTLFNNAAHDNSGSGFLVSVSNPVFAHGNLLNLNNAYNNSGEGFALVNPFGEELTNNNATGNGASGFSAILSDYAGSTGSVIFSGNRAESNNESGFYLESINFNFLLSNVASGNDVNGFYLNPSSNNTLTFNLASGNGASGFSLTADSHGNQLNSNNATGNAGGEGFYVAFGPSNNTLSGNTASGNGDSGFGVSSASDNTLAGNAAHDNSFAGFFLVFGASGTALNGNAAYNNNFNGLYISDSNGTAVSGMHFYNNGKDFQISGSGITLNMSGAVFDSAAGNFTNYTNLTINDLVDSEYTVDHTDPIAVPPLLLPFEGKFVNMTNLTPGVSIDQVIWRWTDAESAGYVESSFGLYKYNGSWWRINDAPDTAANTFTNFNISAFSTFAILQDNTPPTNPDNGPGAPAGALDLSVTPACHGFVARVEDSGEAVPDAFLEGMDQTDSQPLSPAYTNSTGEAFFPVCNVTVFLDAHKSGSEGTFSGFVACGECPATQCTTDADCPSAEMCSQDLMCVPVPCPNGTVVDHKCQPYECNVDADCGSGETCQAHACMPGQPECSTDSDCPSTQYCDSGSCKDVQAGACGEVRDHAFVPYGYECGTEPGCSLCPAGYVCIDHACLQNDLTCPSTGIVGQQTTCQAVENNESCVLCDIRVTGPDGKEFTGRTDENGNFELPLTLQGAYQVALLKNGTVIKTITVQSLPKTTPGEEQPPTATGPDAASVLWLLIILLLAAVGIIYWRRRGGGKK
jgi:parallel beta-helix repeat protein